MIDPAARAALIAVLSIGLRDWDMAWGPREATLKEGLARTKNGDACGTDRTKPERIMEF